MLCECQGGCGHVTLRVTHVASRMAQIMTESGSGTRAVSLLPVCAVATTAPFSSTFSQHTRVTDTPGSSFKFNVEHIKRALRQKGPVSKRPWSKMTLLNF